MLLPTANLWFNLSNIALLVGAFLILAGTYGVYKTGGIKERYSDERISAAEEGSAKANESAEILKGANLVLQRDVERERTARLKIESKLAYRHLSDAQASRLKTVLTPFTDTKIEIASVMYNDEAYSFANEFLNLFVGAKWKPVGVMQEAYPVPVSGVHLVISDADFRDNRVPNGVGVLAQTLVALGLATAEHDSTLPAGTVTLRIGAKAQ